ncbi:MAG: CBS domain-containing protein [Acidimicrobiales bacterium]
MPIVSDMMTTEPCTLATGATLVEAARVMRDRDVGDVIVIDDDGRVQGLVTDRDIAVRAIADGRDPSATAVQEVCTSEPVTVGPDTEVGEVVRLMRDHAVRRIPVVADGGQPLGLVSLGDLAREFDQTSAMADIAEQPPQS